MPPVLLLGEVFQACATGRRSQHTLERLSAALVVPAVEVEEVARTRRAEHVVRLLSCDKNLVKWTANKKAQKYIFFMKNNQN